MKRLAYAALCFLLVVGLLTFQPGDSISQPPLTTVNEELLQQAEDAGLLTAELPAGAERVTYNGCTVNGVLTGEIYFVLNDTTWCYRCAPTDAVTEIPDISELEGKFATVEDTAILERGGKLFVNSGETGKIIWLDAAPGLVYSLTMDSHADGGKLQSIAGFMFTPVQGNA